MDDSRLAMLNELCSLTMSLPDDSDYITQAWTNATSCQPPSILDLLNPLRKLRASVSSPYVLRMPKQASNHESINAGC